MPDELKNLDEGQVPTSDEATDEELTLEKVSKMKPEELLDLAKNSREAIAAATRRNMETAELRKRYEAEHEYLISERQRKDDELRNLYDQNQRLYQMTSQQPGQRIPPSPRLEDIPPEEAYKRLYEDNQKLYGALNQLEEQRKRDRDELSSKIDATQRAIQYREFYKENVFPKYGKYVKPEDIEEWMTQRPNMPFDSKTTLLAAQEIYQQKDAEFEAEVQRRLKEKARKAEQSNVPVDGAPLAALGEGKKMTDLSYEEQQAVFERDFKQLTGQ